MDHHHLCLNCREMTTKNFCANCGQKADTHRITLKHFLLHDLLHGVWHFEKGILFTIKETFVRPGQAALDYIGGKRVRYYNVFYLCLLIIGLNIVAIHFLGPLKQPSSKSSSEMITFMGEHIKLIILGFVPVMSVNGILLFRRLKLNLAEHFIIAGMCLLGIMICALVFISMRFFWKIDFWYAVIGIIQKFILFAGLLFPVWTYYNATRKLYAFMGFAWRILAFYLLICLELLVFLAIIILTVTSDSDLIING